jgi:hypothetical protein
MGYTDRIFRYTMTDQRYLGDSKILAESALFTTHGKPRIYPANILLRCQGEGCDNMFWSHLPYSRWCSNSCRVRASRIAEKARNEQRWAKNRRKREAAERRPRIEAKAAKALGGKRIRITTPDRSTANPRDKDRR